MFPTNQADVGPNGQTMDRRLDTGTTMVPVPKARRLLMMSAAEAETKIKSINRESALALARDVVRLEAQAHRHR